MKVASLTIVIELTEDVDCRKSKLSEILASMEEICAREPGIVSTIKPWRWKMSSRREIGLEEAIGGAAINKIDHLLQELVGEIADTRIDVSWEYDYDPGCYTGLPENCWPEDESCEAWVEENDRQQVSLAITALVCEKLRQILDVVKAGCESLPPLDDEVRAWAKEEADWARDSAADAEYERRREERFDER